MTRYSSTITEALKEIREGFSTKQIKMAIGIASDKRYAGGNMTGAVKAIEKIKKGLSDHPQVRAVLQRQNEDIQEDGHTDVASAKDQVKIAMTALQKMEMELGKLNDEDSLPSWWTNKVAVAVDNIDGMSDYLDTQVEEIDEGKMKDRLMKAQDLMGPSKNREQGIEFVMKGLKVSKREATKLVDAVLDMVMNNEVEIDEMKMDDPKLVRKFDKLKRGDTVKLKTSSTISKGTDFVDYVVKAKNTVNKGRVEKITLVTKGNEKAVKKFLYKRDGQVTFAIGDMGASIDDIKEAAHELAEKLKVSDGVGAWIKDFQKSDAPQFQGKSEEDRKKMAIAAFADAGGKLEETELDEAVKYQFVAIDRLGKVIGFASDEKDAKDMARRGHTMDSPSKGKGVVGRNKAKVVKLKKPMSDKQGDMMINRDFDMNKFGGETTYSIGLKEEDKPDKPDSAKAVDQMRDDKKKTRIAQLQLQIAKASEMINKLNSQEKPDA